jgi:hypothetical protein
VDSLSRLAPLSGVMTVVLFGVGSAIWAVEQPPRDAATEELISFYEGTSIEILIGGTMSIIAVLFFVWFGALLRERLVAAEGSERTGLPLVAFAGTVITAAVGLGAETINMAGALSAEDGQLTADTAQVYFDVSYALGAPSAGVGIAMVAVPTAVIALRTGRPIRPCAAWAALLVGVAALTPAMLTPAFGLVTLLALLLLAGLSIQLYRERGVDAASRTT